MHFSTKNVNNYIYYGCKVIKICIMFVIENKKGPTLQMIKP